MINASSRRHISLLFEKEKDKITGYSYFGFRYLDSEVSVWLSVDPLSDIYPSTSPYAYVENNPIMFIDPNGMSKDGFTVDKEGNINRVDDTGGSEYDVLFNKSDYDAGNTNEEDGLIIKDTQILEQLSEIKHQINRVDAVGTITKVGNRRVAITDAKSKLEMKKVFLFCANNSDVEWNLQVAMIDGDLKYGVSTNGFDDNVTYIFKLEYVLTAYHSHPNPLNYSNEVGSLYGDRIKSKKRSHLQYVYMKNSSNLFRVYDGKYCYMRNIKNNPRRLLNLY